MHKKVTHRASLQVLVHGSTGWVAFPHPLLRPLRSRSVVLPAPCRKFVCAQCKFIFSFFCGNAAHCSALALLYLMSRTHKHTHTVTHIHTRMVCYCDRDRRKSVSEMSEKCFARYRVSLAAKSNEYKQSVHSGESRGLHEEFLASTWHLAEIAAEGIVCAPGSFLAHSLPRSPPARLHGNENCPFVQQSVVIYVLPAVSSCNRMCTTLYIQISSIYVSNTIPPLHTPFLLPSFLFGMRLRPWGQVQNATNAAVLTLESYFE